jgi:uncharacterized protein (UPF0261 family)
MPIVVLLGTCDTKGPEYAYLRARVLAAGCEPLLVDAGVMDAHGVSPDIANSAVAAAAGADLAVLRAAGDRGAAVQTMAAGATAVLRELFAAGRCHAVLTVGGSGNASIGAQAMRALPIGVPKLIVSTMAAGDTRPYIGTSDIAMLYSVVDIAGVNQVSERILSNAACAAAGMAHGYAAFVPAVGSKPVIAATMFGVTTPAVTGWRRWAMRCWCSTPPVAAGAAWRR